MLTDLQGQIERITFTNEDNGYTITRLKVYGRRDLVTIVGNLMSPVPDEVLKLKGEWKNHPKFGEQFQVVHYQSVVPATVQGIRKYLGSGLIKGIGPVMAKRIVDVFGKETLEIIEDDIERLIGVEGIGLKRIEMIRTAWDAQREIRQVMIFLQDHSVSSTYATRIFKEYGDNAIKVVQENPYRLARDIWGIGFLTADKIAEKLGFTKDSELRVQAGILYVLQQLSDEGHVYYPDNPLVEKAGEILEVDREIISQALQVIAAEKMVVIEDLIENCDDVDKNDKAVYLTGYFLA